MYADKITDSMQKAIDETNRRREKQAAFNEAHGIIPKTIIKSVREMLEISSEAGKVGRRAKIDGNAPLTQREREAEIRELEKKMKEASKMLEFEYAALLRDRIVELRGAKGTAT